MFLLIYGSITNQPNDLLTVGLLSRLAERYNRIVAIQGSNLVQAWIFQAFYCRELLSQFCWTPYRVKSCYLRSLSPLIKQKRILIIRTIYLPVRNHWNTRWEKEVLLHVTWFPLTAACVTHWQENIYRWKNGGRFKWFCDARIRIRWNPEETGSARQKLPKP